MYDDMRAHARQDELTLDAGPLLTRRHTLQGLAWAAPAIVVARAVPADASSQAAPVTPTYAAGAIVSYGGSTANNSAYWVDGTPYTVRQFSQWLGFKDAANLGNPYSGLVSLTMEITVKHIQLDSSGAPVYGFNYAKGDNETWALKSFDVAASRFTFTCKLDLSGAARTQETSIPIGDFWTQVKNASARFSVNLYGPAVNGTETVTWSFAE